MIVHFESCTCNPRKVYLNILDFLQLPDDGRNKFEPAHSAKRHKSKMLARITQRPPNWLMSLSLMSLSWLARRLTGHIRLWLAKAPREFNSESGYEAIMREEFKAEIAEYYLESNSRLRRLITEKGIREL